MLQFSPVPDLEIKNDETPTKSSHHVVIDWRWSHIPYWMSLILYLVGPCVDCWHHLVEFSKVWRQFVNTHHHLSILVSQFSTYCGALSYPSGWGGFPVKLGIRSSNTWLRVSLWSWRLGVQIPTGPFLFNHCPVSYPCC